MNLEALCADSIRAIDQISHEVWLKSHDVAALQVNEKAVGDVATDIDLWAEVALREQLIALLPGSQFMGEETGGALTHQPTWIVDPIDGTANFARGYPQWSMSVALAMEGEPVLGVIADPNRQEIFYAARGQGAWLQSRLGLQRLVCAKVTEPLKATVSTVFPKPLSPLMPAYLAEFERVIRAFAQVRRSGSMALELAYVAADVLHRSDAAPLAETQGAQAHNRFRACGGVFDRFIEQGDSGRYRFPGVTVGGGGAGRDQSPRLRACRRGEQALKCLFVNFLQRQTKDAVPYTALEGWQRGGLLKLMRKVQIQ